MTATIHPNAIHSEKILKPDQITRVSAPDLTRDLDLLDDEVASLLDFTREVEGRAIPLWTGFGVVNRSRCCSRSTSLRTRMTFELAIQQVRRIGGDAEKARSEGVSR